jgi:hypothetical protein
MVVSSQIYREGTFSSPHQARDPPCLGKILGSFVYILHFLGATVFNLLASINIKVWDRAARPNGQFSIGKTIADRAKVCYFPARAHRRPAASVLFAVPNLGRMIIIIFLVHAVHFWGLRNPVSETSPFEGRCPNSESCAP